MTLIIRHVEDRGEYRPQLLIIRHSEDREYDRYILAPIDMGLSEAADKADEIIAKLRADTEDDDDPSWDCGIEDALAAEGFIPIHSWYHCSEEI